MAVRFSISRPPRDFDLYFFGHLSSDLASIGSRLVDSLSGICGQLRDLFRGICGYLLDEPAGIRGCLLCLASRLCHNDPPWSRIALID